MTPDILIFRTNMTCFINFSKYVRADYTKNNKIVNTISSRIASLHRGVKIYGVSRIILLQFD